MINRLLALFLGLVPLAGAHAADSAAATNRWEREIRAFEAADKTNPPPQGAILFIGSSTIARWPNISRAFPGHTVFKRGFGGSELSDSVAYVGRIVVPYPEPPGRKHLGRVAVCFYPAHSVQSALLLLRHRLCLHRRTTKIARRGAR